MAYSRAQIALAILVICCLASVRSQQDRVVETFQDLFNPIKDVFNWVSSPANLSNKVDTCHRPGFHTLGGIQPKGTNFQNQSFTRTFNYTKSTPKHVNLKITLKAVAYHEIDCAKDYVQILIDGKEVYKGCNLTKNAVEGLCHPEMAGHKDEILNMEISPSQIRVNPNATKFTITLVGYTSVPALGRAWGFRSLVISSIGCGSTCLDCEDHQACTTCHATATLFTEAGTGKKKCQCKGDKSSPVREDPLVCTLSCDPSCDGCSDVDVCDKCSGGSIHDPKSKNHCICTAGWFSTGAAPKKCAKCHDSCKECINGGQGDCTACPEGAHYVKNGAGGTCPCIDGFFTDKVAPFCKRCSANCKTCNSSHTCTSCPEHSTLSKLSNGSVVCQCNDGFYQQNSGFNTPLVCRECDHTCHTCKGAGDHACLSCQGGLELVHGQCIKCHTSCHNCNGTTEGSCTTCTMNALLVHEAAGSFCRCGRGYFDKSRNTHLECGECDGSCLSCKGEHANDCTQCTSTATLKNGECHCNSGHFATTSGFTHHLECKACDVSCLECDGDGAHHCTACKPGLELVDKACIKCHGGCNKCAGVTADNCTSCSANAHIRNNAAKGPCDCNAGFWSPGNNPLKCDHYTCDKSCKTCMGPHKDHCTSCNDDQHKLVNGTCVEISCHPTCATCNGTTVNDCKSCVTNATLIQKGGTNQHYCECESRNGVYQSSKEGERLQCARCHPSCKTCDGAGANHCKSCSPDLAFYDQAHKNCSCMSGTYLYTPDPWKCAHCDASCAECSGNGKNQCTKCAPGKKLVNGHCYECSKICADCHGEGDFNCTACAHDAELVHNATMKGDTCACKKGFYSELHYPLTCQRYTCDKTCKTCHGPKNTHCDSCFEDANLTNGVCRPWNCHKSCVACRGPTEEDCTACTSGGVLTMPDAIHKPHAHVCHCDSNHYVAEKLPLTCSSCDPTCKTCVGKGEEQCASCAPNAELVPRSTGGKSCKCMAGYYEVSKTPLTCSKCDKSCATCSGPSNTQCITCHAGDQHLNSGRCITCAGVCKTCDDVGLHCSTCPDHAHLVDVKDTKNHEKTCNCTDGFWSESTNVLNCKPYTCDASCKTCVGPKKNHCLTCTHTESIRLVNGVCEDIHCHSTCVACSGEKETDCMRCTDKAKLVKENNAARCVCIDGTYEKSRAPLQCISCDPSCVTCDGSGQNNCKKCHSNSVLQEVTVGSAKGHKCHCNDGFYTFLNTTHYECMRCHSSCHTCSGATSNQCTSCEQGMKLVNGACIKCHGSCADCDGVGETRCTKCGPNADLKPAMDGHKCECHEKFYSETNSPLKCEPYVCDSSCKTCNGPHKNQCTSCHSDEFKLEGGACRPIQCHPNCHSCYGTLINNCKTCTTNARTVTAGNGTHCACKEHFKVKKAEPLECIEIVCDPHCQTCKGETSEDCESCTANAKLTVVPGHGAKCVCADGYYSEVLGKMTCKHCTAPCVTCNGPAADQCLSCPHGLKLINGKCIKCHDVCTDCRDAGANKCTACPEHAELVNVDGGQTCKCKGGFYSASAAPLHCVPYHCDKSCLPCNGTTPGDSPNNCSSHCVGPDPTHCTKCIDEAQLLSNPGVCKPIACHQSCARCTNNTAQGCKTCTLNADLKNGECHCAAHTYQSSAGTHSLTCDKCHSTCDSCAGPLATQCLNCTNVHAHVVISDSAKKTGACQCEAGRFLNPENGVECVRCHISCSECSGPNPNQCKECPKDHKLVQGTCITCHPLCKDCAGTGPFKCTACGPNQHLQNSVHGTTCVCADKFFSRPTDHLDCQPYTCHKSCGTCYGPDDTMCLSCSDPSTELVHGKCVPRNCNKTCATCSGPAFDQCLTCTAGADIVKLAGGKQTCACHAGYERTSIEPLRCELIPCHDSCVTCKARGPSGCTQCKPNSSFVMVYANGTEITTPGVQGFSECLCNHGFYLSTSNGWTCKQCDATCKTCKGPNFLDCTTCQPDYVLRNGKCVKCHETCLDCSDNGPSKCVSCRETWDLIRKPDGTGCTCKKGYSGPKCDVYHCDESCKTCSGPAKTQCVTCPPDYDLDKATHQCFPTKCHPECLNCDLTTWDGCTRCADGSTLEYKSLTINHGHCQPKPGYHGENVTTGKNTYTKWVPTCDPNCGTCTAPGWGNCRTCGQEGAMPHPFPNRSIVCVCQEGYYQVNQTNGKLVCKECDESCITCTGPSSHECTACPVGQALVHGSCKCHGSCDTCDGHANNCKSCTANADLVKAGDHMTCKCFKGFQASGTGDHNRMTCDPIPCDGSCALCAAPDSESCHTCSGEGTRTDPKKDFSACECVPPANLWSTSPYLCSQFYVDLGWQ